MNRTIRTKLMVICALVFAFAAAFWSHPKLLRAQQNTGETYTGSFYISAYIDVDSGYNVYGTSVVQSDDYTEAEDVGAEGYISQDASYIAYDSDSGYDRVELNLSSDGPVTPGHDYGVETDGYECSSYGEYDEECYDVEYIASAYASVYVSYPPHIASISPSSAYQGDQGTLTISGSNLIQYNSDQLTLNFPGGGNPFTLTSSPSTCTSSCTATFSYNLSGFSTGTYNLTVTNDEGTSNAVSLTIQSAQVLDECDVTSNPHAGYTAITGTPGGSGSLAISFSGTAYAAISQSVPYGPGSTPNSIAAHIAALLTRNYFRYGLTAKAYGPNIVYSGYSTIGTVTNSFSGSSFGANTLPTAASDAENACEGAELPAHVQITSASLYGNNITVNLQGPQNSNTSGTVTVNLIKSSGNYSFPFGSGQVQAGSYTITMNRPNIPVGKYIAIEVDRATPYGTASGTYSITWNVFGSGSAFAI